MTSAGHLLNTVNGCEWFEEHQVPILRYFWLFGRVPVGVSLFSAIVVLIWFAR